MSTYPAQTPEDISGRAWVAQHKVRDAGGRFAQQRQETDSDAVVIPLVSPHADQQKQRYLDLLAGGACVKAACDAIGVSTWRPYQWEKYDRDFAEALAIVGAGIVGGVLESNLRRIGRGDSTAAFLATAMELKARDPARYARPELREVDGATDRLAAAMERAAAALERNQQQLDRLSSGTAGPARLGPGDGAQDHPGGDPLPDGGG